MSGSSGSGRRLGATPVLLRILQRPARSDSAGSPTTKLLVIALIIFGPKRLPDLGRALGGGMREFKNSVTGADRDELGRADASDTPKP